MAEKYEMDGYFAVFNCHLNNARKRARKVMRGEDPKGLSRFDGIVKRGGGVMAIFERDPTPDTKRFVELVTQFVNEDRVPRPKKENANG